MSSEGSRARSSTDSSDQVGPSAPVTLPSTDYLQHSPVDAVTPELWVSRERPQGVPHNSGFAEPTESHLLWHVRDHLNGDGRSWVELPGVVTTDRLLLRRVGDRDIPALVDL